MTVNNITNFFCVTIEESPKKGYQKENVFGAIIIF